jgi:TatD DNase family protein
MFVDSHAHIDGVEYEADRLEVIQRARAAGVHTILNVVSGDLHGGAFERAVQLADNFHDVYAALGVHPHDAKLFDESVEERIETLIKSSDRVIAWGEIGLDYHYDNSPREVQRDVFRRQLRRARERNLPVIIHTREAEADTIEILREEWTGTDCRGVMHCFSGSEMLAEATLELGFLISFAGVLTFKKADDLRAVAAGVPLDRTLIETDCPFLTPVPFRGRRNEPAHVVEVARSLAAIHDKSLEEIAGITSANFAALFPATQR